MLAPDQLAALYRQHRNDPVLSIYLDADEQDFAERGKWQIVLKNELAEQRDRADDRASFDRAYEYLKAPLEEHQGGFLTGKGWVGFATPDGLLHSESLPVPMPNLVRWEDGLRVAPYARVLKQARPVIGVVIDSRQARLLRYRMGRLAQRDVLEADTFMGDLADVNVSKVASTHSGIRGQTSTDAARKVLDVERERLVARVAEEVRKEVGRDGLLVLGGAERTVDALERELGDFAAERRRSIDALHLDLSNTEIRTAVERAASEISAALNGTLLERLIGDARSGGSACLGEEETARALVEGRVATLVISESFRNANPDRADHFEGTAFEHGADVIEMGRDPGARLQSEGGGVGALLRYRVDP